VTAEIGNPNLDNAPWHTEGDSDLCARPTIDNDALDDLASLSNADCSAA
jgi:hypothetical protein